MKSTLLTLALFSVLQISAQTSPRASVLQDERNAQRQRIQQQNAQTMQHTAVSRQSAQQQEWQSVKREWQEETHQNQTVSYAFPPVQAHSATYFKQSMSELQRILDGQQDLSLKRAVFLSENAFLDNSLSYEWFCKDIATQIDVLKAFMKKEGLNTHDATSKKYMLQKFFSDTLVMRDAKGNYQFTHYPFTYDFDDPYGRKDWRKMFVTKLLRDKKGQCHSLPLLYLILAEALHVKAWLAYSPEHAYIKTQDAQGTWFNFETTNGHYSTDTWLLSSAYVKAEAMKNKIYLDTLSKRETVAACLVDLAMGYKEKFGFDAFILEAVNKALECSPRNIYALQLKADYQTYLFRYIVKQLNYPPKSELYRYPKAYELFKIAGDLHNLIDQLGYEEMPQTMYESWLQSFEREKNKQTIQVIKP